MSTNVNEDFLRAHIKVRELVADFQENEVTFLSMGYSEQAARKDFIDKFFTAFRLGCKSRHPEEPLQARGEGRAQRTDRSVKT